MKRKQVLKDFGGQFLTNNLSEKIYQKILDKWVSLPKCERRLMYVTDLWKKPYLEQVIKLMRINSLFRGYTLDAYICPDANTCGFFLNKAGRKRVDGFVPSKPVKKKGFATR